MTDGQKKMAAIVLCLLGILGTKVAMKQPEETVPVKTGCAVSGYVQVLERA